jgi:hypothetical protein
VDHIRGNSVFGGKNNETEMPRLFGVTVGCDLGHANRASAALGSARHRS